MERVLITGVTGYIGSHLARALSSDCRVFGLTRQPIRREYISDIQDRICLLPCDGGYEGIRDAVRESQPDLVYHLATYYTGAHNAEAVPKLVASNIALGAYLLEAMAESGCHALVNATSVMTCRTGNEYCPQNLYAATKQAFSDLLAYYTDAGMMRAVTLMLPDTYGPNDARPKILNLIKTAALKGEHIALSAGTQDYDVVYIDDVVSAFRMAGERLLAGEGKAMETFQVFSEHTLSLRRTVELMLKLNGLTLDAGWGERIQSPREMKKAVRLYPTVPDWRQKVPLEEGLKLFWTDGVRTN